MDQETLAIHPPYQDDLLNSSITHPIYLSSTFPRNPDGSYPNGYSYSRGANPNRKVLEEALTALEGGTSAACFASGAAAALAVFQALGTGDHVLVPRVCYHGTHTILREIFPRWGLTWDAVDMSSPLAVKAAIKPATRLIWVETPANPNLQITDLNAIAEIAHNSGALCIADNTVATAILQQPFLHGCDLVVYSTTKYISGHSDVIGGAVIAKSQSEFLEQIRMIQIHGGAVPSPFDCWLTLRGMKTLPLRIRAQSENAQKIAEYLSHHPKVSVVYYPGLRSHPGHHLAVSQMKAFGGLLSFELKGGKDGAMNVVRKTKLIRRATSLGGVESLIEHRASMEGRHSTTSEGLLRLSVGLESIQDLLSDIEQALR